MSLLLLALLSLASARPVVRSIKSADEFDRLIAKHATQTGLPVVVDFYSDGCGPCRQMAPIYKRMAKEVFDKAVFVKVDTNRVYELSSKYAISSIPTFMFFLGGKKVNSFSGAGEGQLRQMTEQVIGRAERENTVLKKESLVKFYGKVDGEKTQEAIDSVYKKCAEMSKGNKSGLCIGSPAKELARKLKGKYKESPLLEKRFTEEDQKPKPTTTNNTPKGDNNKANLHLATKEELQAEMEKRLEAEQDEEEEEEEEFDSWVSSGFPERVTIIGSGPAGLSAALYAARAGLTPLVIAPPLGGQLQGKGVDVENYPGMINVTGPAVVAVLRSQALVYGALFETESVLRVDTSSRPFLVHTNSSTIKTHAIIVATGADSNWLGVPGEYDMRGGGVSTCATCDGAAYYQRDVLVVGGGDTAMEDALVLARTSKSVTLVHRRDTFRASKILATRVIQNPSITVLYNTTLIEILGQDSITEEEEDVDLDAHRQKVVTHARLHNTYTLETTLLPVSAVFVAIGHKPNTAFISDNPIDFSQTHPGYLQTFDKTTRTSVPGIFAAGDVSDWMYRQAITSAGSGAQAALDAERWLSEEGLGNEEAEFEAEMLRELMGENEQVEDVGYNAYEDLGAHVKGIKESIAVGSEL